MCVCVCVRADEVGTVCGRDWPAVQDSGHSVCVRADEGTGLQYKTVGTVCVCVCVCVRADEGTGM